ncbi:MULTISPECIES: cytochrome c biogenesis CcdA family protein [Micrococcales]|jgi:cytochrome c biogenesis protein CcdA|uniref:Cytochrome c biogenesis protein CcdA n=2 Tax=Micrococcales TaxID=85006 RepID=A0A6I3IK78_9MICO|nr:MULTISPECIES: cytochrome c biogenesis protein CcdA [Micrococcales]MTB73053.1 cytochrome c biogenesis protein CcdA [Arsenicicoccus cauae]REF30054.1 cytochrome c biogenesis protein CcdA [Calidifontibacter indicus]
MGGLLTLAFAAGMVAPVNPCGFALLPAWLTQTLGEGDASPTPVRLLRALRSGLALTVGFAGTLAAAGLLVSAGARGLIQAAPRLGLAVGIVLMLLGLWMLVGRSISLKLPQIPGRSTAGLPPTARMVVFGVGYALASLSCTFGVILAVIAQAQATASYAGLLLVFAVYAAGSAAVLLLLALATAAAGTELTRHVARLARFGPRITALVLLLTGAYLAWYWFPAATSDAPVAAGRTGGLTGLSATVSSWVQEQTSLLTLLAAAAVVLALALGILQRRRMRAPRRDETVK